MDRVLTDLEAAIEATHRVDDRLGKLERNRMLDRVFIIFIVLTLIGAFVLFRLQGTSNCDAINKSRSGRYQDAQALIAVANQQTPGVAESPPAQDYLTRIRTATTPLDCGFWTR